MTELTMDKLSIHDANEHEVFRQFRQNLPPVCPYYRSIMEVKNDRFYMMEEVTGKILATRSSSFVHPDVPQTYQVFEPQGMIQGRVIMLRVSEDNMQVAVVTTRFLYVIDVPHDWTGCTPSPALLRGRCRNWLINPERTMMHRLFEYQILQLKWDPKQNHRLFILYNDNYIKLFDTQKRILMKILSVGSHDLHPLSNDIPNRNLVIDFDFIPNFKKWADKKEFTETPLMLIRGNGDVFFAYITKTQGLVSNVITMKPEIEMDYNNNACSILVIPCQPTIVAIACYDGTIYHAVLMDDTTEKVLRVFEQCQIDVCHYDAGKRFSSPFNLFKDTGCLNRYYVLHDAGLHAVNLSVVSFIQKLTAETELSVDLQKPSKTFSKEDFNFSTTESESIIRHLLSTNALGNPALDALLGIAIIPSRMTTEKIVALQADGKPISIRMNTVFPTDLTLSLGKRVTRTDFRDIVSNLLYGKGCEKPPLLQVGKTPLGNHLQENAKEESDTHHNRG